jgi:UDP-2-acetamido-2,6-beta-L-arabino-hexul-4-ose reductase
MKKTMRLLITGAKGFIGKNLIAELLTKKCYTIYSYDKETPTEMLDLYCKDAEFVIHLAGVNRPKEISEYNEGNTEFTSTVIDSLKRNHNNCPVLLSSSIQAQMSNPYGISKKKAEDLLQNYSKETGAKVLIYRLPNVFGKWCMPNYNNVIATFCYNIARGIPIIVYDSETVINMVYIDNVIEEIIEALNGNENQDGDYCKVGVEYFVKLGEIVKSIQSFKSSRLDLSVPNMADELTKKLLSTYLSYLPENQFKYNLNMMIDKRGSFTEFIRTPDRGQISINVSKPGITKGNHWHHSKHEKFLVVSGKGVIRFRNLQSNKIIEYYVSSDIFEVIDIPPGYIHSIENIGINDLITVIWANETYQEQNNDTNAMEVMG